MKKINKILNSLVVSTALLPSAGIMTTMYLTSCGNNLYSDLQAAMIKEFKAMCNIPHSSDQFLYQKPYTSNVIAMSNHLQKRFEDITGQHIWQDKYGNLWFDVPANCEELKDVATIGIQAHMDMVFSFDPEKYTPGNYPDPLTTTIDLVEDVVDGRKVLHSRDYKTSIGADNGMGVAQILAILGNKNVKHGKLRVIITNCEENAMQGAKMLVDGHKAEDGTTYEATNPDVLKDVNYVLNIDGEDLGDICIACSGGVGSHYTKEGSLVDTTTLSALTNKFKIRLSGFKGGHSGSAINKKYGNALKILNEILVKLQNNEKNNIAIANINTTGTTVYNKIPTECTVEILTDKSQTDIEAAFGTVKDEHAQSSEKWQQFVDLPGAKLEISNADFTEVISPDDTSNIISLQDSLKYGVETWTEPTEETQNKTSSNIAPASVTFKDKKYTYKVSSYSRSDKTDRVIKFHEENKKVAVDNKFEYLCDAIFPGFETKEDEMNLCKLTKAAWINAGIKEDKVTISKIHGGVECSWWVNVMKTGGTARGQSVSYGPQLKDCHMPTETVYLDTVQECLKTTLFILENAEQLPALNK